MNIFLSTFVNKIDKKGRVSIPATYRSVLSVDHFSGIVVYPSIKNKCIEACSMSRLLELSKMIEDLAPYSDERDAFETIVLGGAVQLSFDSEGRVLLPDYMIKEISIEEQVCFVGKGRVFEIWHPEAFEKYQKNARDIAQLNRPFLRKSSQSCNI